ncbi:hypothetical protein AB0I55_20430 [Actinocatenispora sera]|uniref:Uncharacterized protein n=1 Tax=Actinocatenispora sera TaxID=390989 RepID=A0A810L2G0_9ACTN|nr:hypothetical protein [Actinocatenispora sera]BCJ28626.1 hypothetical protein Asera_27340 [Actinocatenispora sera]
MNVATQKFMFYSQWAHNPGSVIAKPPMPTYEELLSGCDRAPRAAWSVTWTDDDDR